MHRKSLITMLQHADGEATSRERSQGCTRRAQGEGATLCANSRTIVWNRLNIFISPTMIHVCFDWMGNSESIVEPVAPPAAPLKELPSVPLGHPELRATVCIVGAGAAGNLFRIKCVSDCSLMFKINMVLQRYNFGFDNDFFLLSVLIHFRNIGCQAVTKERCIECDHTRGKRSHWRASSYFWCVRSADRPWPIIHARLHRCAEFQILSSNI